MFILKLHYFLWFGSLSGILPYVPIFAQQHAIATATDVGILFFILPFIASIVKPIFCSMADHYQAHKKIFITFLLLTLNGYGLLLSIPFVTFMGKYSWYLFSALVLVANSSMGVVISLTDFLVMKQVTQNNQNYGSYRVYGTLGWGGFGELVELS
jgi:nitrate/nitrite transporter NarK